MCHDLIACSGSVFGGHCSVGGTKNDGSLLSTYERLSIEVGGRVGHRGCARTPLRALQFHSHSRRRC